MSTIYFFSAALSEQDMLGIYNLGASYDSIFNKSGTATKTIKRDKVTASNDMSNSQNNAEAEAILNGHLANLVMLTFHPSMRNEHCFFDNTPSANDVKWEKSGYFVTGETKQTGIVALPLALAFGVSSGLGPSAGLYGAIFLSFFAALFGGTPTQISGPTAPMTAVSMVIIASIISVHNGSVEEALPYILAVFFIQWSFSDCHRFSGSREIYQIHSLSGCFRFYDRYRGHHFNYSMSSCFGL